MKFLYSSVTEDGFIETVVEDDNGRHVIRGGKLEPEDLQKVKNQMKPKYVSMGYRVERKNMTNKVLYAKILTGDLEGRVLKVTGMSMDMVTVEYVEECFSFTKSEVRPIINSEEMSWSQYYELTGADDV